MILYAGVGIGILVLSLFGDASSEVGFRIEFALRMLVMTAGIVIGVRGVVKKDVAFLLIGAGFVVATYDLSNRWLMYLGMAMWLSGFIAVGYRKTPKPSVT